MPEPEVQKTSPLAGQPSGVEWRASMGFLSKCCQPHDVQIAAGLWQRWSAPYAVIDREDCSAKRVARNTLLHEPRREHGRSCVANDCKRLRGTCTLIAATMGTRQKEVTDASARRRYRHWTSDRDRRVPREISCTRRFKRFRVVRSVLCL